MIQQHSKRKIHWLFESVDGGTLALFRIVWGVALAWEFYRYWPRIEGIYLEPPFYFSYDFFGFVRPWAGHGMYLHFILMGVAALGVALGYYYRFCSVLLFLTFSYFALIEKAKYLNHFYLISLLAFLMIFVRADARWTLLPRRRRRTHSSHVPFWQICILRFQICIVYFFGGVAKINTDWLGGEPMRHWLAGRSYETTWIAPFLATEAATYISSYGGLLFDLLIPFFLLSRKLRPLAIVLVVAFHLTNAWLFTIGVFPWLMLGTIFLFLQPDTPLRIVRRFMPESAGDSAATENEVQGSFSAEGPCSPRVVTGVLGFFFVAQLLLPFRHWLFPGNVAWTEEGHRFAWRMKLRDKTGIVRAVVFDPESGESTVIHPRRYLTHRQYRKMSTRPDMIFQYAYFMKLNALAKGIQNPQIYILAQVSLNGRPFQWIVDPRADFTQLTYCPFRPEPWIIPLLPDTPVGKYPPKPKADVLLQRAHSLNSRVPLHLE